MTHAGQPIPAEQNRPSATRSILITLAVAAMGFAIASAFDSAAYESLHAPGADREDWNRALRVAGYLPLWLVVAAAFILIDWSRPLRPPLRDRYTRGVLLALSAAIAGALAETLKLLLRRERPELHDGAYAFRPFTEDFFSTSGLGLPSSHAAVAFGAAFMLARLHRPAAHVWLLIAAGCALTRVLDRAHFVSDVFLSAIVGYAVAQTLWSLHRRNIARDELARTSAP